MTAEAAPDRRVGFLCWQAAERLKAAQLPEAQVDARLLTCRALSLSHADLIAKACSEATQDQAAALERMLERRLAREPVSRILGEREFYGRSFRISPATLDPRPDSETLVEAVLELLAPRRAEPPRLLDLGTGTGCLLLTLLAEMPEAKGVGADISAEALAVAAENARALQVADRVELAQSSWTEAVSGTFDIILSNPPYIATDTVATLEPEVRLHDPALALDGGADGLDAYRAILRRPLPLAPGGWLVLEVGAGQARQALELMSEAGLGSDRQRYRSWHDLGGIERVVAARAPLNDG